MFGRSLSTLVASVGGAALVTLSDVGVSCAQAARRVPQLGSSVCGQSPRGRTS